MYYMSFMYDMYYMCPMCYMCYMCYMHYVGRAFLAGSYSATVAREFLASERCSRRPL